MKQHLNTAMVEQRQAFPVPEFIFEYSIPLLKNLLKLNILDDEQRNKAEDLKWRNIKHIFYFTKFDSSLSTQIKLFTSDFKDQILYSESTRNLETMIAC